MTNSKAEWAFVVESEKTPEDLGLSRWPAESEEKLPNRSHCRARTPFAELMERAAKYNEQLKEANQPPLVEEELIAGNLYTGPVRAALQPPFA